VYDFTSQLRVASEVEQGAYRAEDAAQERRIKLSAAASTKRKIRAPRFKVSRNPALSDEAMKQGTKRYSV
jgi:hypothetical protein